jgi:cytochrome b561
MQAAIAHFLMLVFAVFIAGLGWFMAHNPTRTLRFFTFGTEPAFGHRSFLMVSFELISLAPVRTHL